MAGATIQLTNVLGELQDDPDGNARVNLPKVANQAGYVVIAGERDGVAGGTRQVRPTNVSLERRLKSGVDSLLFDDTFHHTVLNTRKYLQATTTMTIVQAGNAITLNAGNSVAAGVGAFLRTYKSFQLMNNFSLLVDEYVSTSTTPQNGNVFEVGKGIPGASGVVEPLDGVYMQMSDTGVLKLVANFNGSKTDSGPISFVWAANRIYHIEIMENRDRIELFIDKDFVAGVDRGIAAAALTQNTSGYLFVRNHNITATASAQQLRLHSWAAGFADAGAIRDMNHIRSGSGDHLLSALDGAAVAQLANYANSAAPASATLSNTAAGYTTAGGQFQFAAPAGAETDYALFAWQNPAGTISAPGKTVMVKGIHIDVFNMGAISAGTLTTMQWSLGIGSSAVSLATADGAAARAPHRLTLGTNRLAVGAVIGESADKTISRRFEQGLPVEPGMFLHVIVKIPVGTATASQIIRGVCGIIGIAD